MAVIRPGRISDQTSTGASDISVKGLTKRYGDVVAVDTIDLDIAAAGPIEGEEAKTVGAAAP